MLVRSFVDEYEEAASFLGVPAAELETADVQATALRWLAYRAGEVSGVANGRRRPDGRVFVAFGVTPASAIGPLAEAAVAELGAVYASVGSDQKKDELAAAGFDVEVIDDEFEISFSTAMARMGRLRLPPRFVLEPPHLLAEDRLIALDNELRQDVPGTDGWATTRDMWRAEISSAEYDPSGYLVGIDDVSDVYAGLVRFWRNEDGPRLGLLAVTRPYRGSLLGAALLRAGLEGSSQWGSPTFETSTSPNNRATYPALTRLGMQPVTRRYQMVKRT